ncbi:DUF4232 domain-containing protein [Streptomyces hoynatensis]|uniref:DUF4232 domain-containing protein n=1 Tax=Streptomyces hoynatensis TaxID=1141874 RepID=A0A3A9YTK2_9ACTN|nr:DUF4232 domain-containing protein [Streptomyces hoynatensis]RKN39290.1 DUF4232 domain-containing protein [Streptomyces hoynatensis]
MVNFHGGEAAQGIGGAPVAHRSAGRAAHRSRGRARGIALASGVAVLGLLLSACGDEEKPGEPESLSGTAQPASGDRDKFPQDEATGEEAPEDGAPAEGDEAADGESGGGEAAQGDGASGGQPDSAASDDGAGGNGDGSGSGTRCHTRDLSLEIGQNRPGAGNSHFALVVTNGSDENCLLYGYPGAAFVDGSGRQVGGDPEREEIPDMHPVALGPGESAWAGLSFANPNISGATTAVPAYLWVTPPDETDSLAMPWTQGEVPVSGDVPSVSPFVLGDGS